MVTTVFRLGNVDTETAERFEFTQPAECHAVNRATRRILGGSWAIWWLKTPLPGVVWCNCPHMTGYDGLSVEDLTEADREGRKKIAATVDYVREHYPGFGKAVVIDVAPPDSACASPALIKRASTSSPRTTWFKPGALRDSVARGRGYYTPLPWAMLPRGVEQLLVAGRHYSVTPEAQKLSREIPPCMSMGEAAGVAAVEALNTGATVRDVDVATVQRRLRAQGADPGDVPSPRARLAGS